MSLTDMVLMPGKDYQNICHTLREKGNTDTPITSDMVSPMIQTIAKSMEYEDGLLTGNMPEVYENDRAVSVRTYAFRNVKHVKVVRLTNVENVETGGFSYFPGEAVCLPKLKQIGSAGMNHAKNLSVADMGFAEQIGANTFFSDNKLGTVILRKTDTPAKLTGMTAFSGTPFYGIKIKITANGSYAPAGALGFRAGTADTSCIDHVQDPDAADGWAIRIKPGSVDTYRVKLRTSAGNSGSNISSAEVAKNANDGAYHLYKTTLTMPETSVSFLKIYAFSDYLQVTGGLLDRLSAIAGEDFDVYYSMKVENTEENGLVYYVDRMIITTQNSDVDAVAGRIYVPAALIEQYKTETNWSALYGYGNFEFTAIEGSEYQ